MGWLLGRVRRSIFGIPRREVGLARRGFLVGTPGCRRRLESIGETFLEGYHAALTETEPSSLASRLAVIAPDDRGFAFEGAAMGLALLDRLTPGGGGRVRRFLAGPAAAQAYLVHVGVGWAVARVGGLGAVWASLDPLLRWLILDGYGFHEGYFHWRRYAGGGVPSRFPGTSRRVFDQGLGRSLWFVLGAEPGAIRQAVERLAEDRRPDLWAGVGLACAYAGGAEPAAVQALIAAAGRHRPQLAQGVAFAAKARQRADNPALHTELACRLVCDVGADEAARVTDLALAETTADGAPPGYEVWRARIQDHFAGVRAVTTARG